VTSLGMLVPSQCRNDQLAGSKFKVNLELWFVAIFLF
jgi:hypothetical protein